MIIRILLVAAGGALGTAARLGLGLTLSTAMFDTVALWRNGERPASAFNLLGTFVLSVAAALAGLVLVSVV